VKPEWIVRFNRGQGDIPMHLIWPGIISLDGVGKKRDHISESRDRGGEYLVHNATLRIMQMNNDDI